MELFGRSRTFLELSQKNWTKRDNGRMVIARNGDVRKHHVFGRIFESLYEGSMVGSGSAMFAVWGYVIANMRADKEVGAQVDLNPKLLAFILGEDESVVGGVIKKLCSPDPQSRSKAEDGRRLIQVGTFSYRVVNGARYMETRNLEEKRANDRNRKRKERLSGKPVNGSPERGELVDGKNMDNPSWRPV